jgi:glycerol-3-phosphate acyltransferase PlsY
MIVPWLMVLGAYVAGAVPFGYLICRARGVDVRTVGSGNIGATNVARAAGKPLGALALLLDLAKGLGPTLAARAALAAHARRDVWVAAVMLAAVLGHVFSIFLRLRGGKGVATALGVTSAVCPLAGGAGVAIYALLYATTRISSVGSLAGTAAAMITVWACGAPRPIAVAATAITLLIVVRHHANLRRLFRGEERRV